MAQTTATTAPNAIAAALEPTGHPHPLLEDAGPTTPVRAAGLLTEAQQTLTYDASGGFHTTAPIETDARDIDCEEPNDGIPFLAAQAVVNDFETEKYGRVTTVWLHYGRSTGELTPAKTRQVAQEMREFAARLEALCDVADEIAADDYEARA